MKKCENIRDLILTDYIDGELDKNLAHNLEGHLLDCADCRQFFKEVKANCALLSKEELNQEVPSELWAAIKENIEHKQARTNPLEYLVEKLKGLIVFPRLVPVFASLIVMLLVGSVTVNTIQVKQEEQEQGEYLVALLGPTETSTSTENTDLGTSIEHYFL